MTDLARSMLDCIVRAERACAIERRFDGPIPPHIRHWAEKGAITDAERIAAGEQHADELEVLSLSAKRDPERLTAEALKLRRWVAEVKAEQRSAAA